MSPYIHPLKWVVLRRLVINDSKPAYNFKPIVFPNEWSKSKPQNQNLQQTSQKSERYRAYFQELIDELREQHHFTSAKAGQPQSWFAFASGRAGISYGANFGLGNIVIALKNSHTAKENRRITYRYNLLPNLDAFS